jgi:hypothetical protein
MRIVVLMVCCTLVHALYALADTVVDGDLKLTGGGEFIFSDNTHQATAQVQGPKGDPGPPGDTRWGLNGSDIYYTDGKVGIGTTAPNEQLEITGNIRLPATKANAGIIKQGANTLIHTINDDGFSPNFFAGINSGNLTMTGATNTGVGTDSLSSNSTGNGNTAIGHEALSSNTSGSLNVALGSQSLKRLTGGTGNTAIGATALLNITAGDHNTVIGNSAASSLDIGSYNIYIGYAAGPTTFADEDESNVLRIGNVQHIARTYIAGIYARTVTGGSAVYIKSDGQLGTTTSSRRYKEEISDMGDASSGIMKLKPVTFYYKPEYASGPRLLQFGLIAEEVAEVYPYLVEYNKNGEPDSVYYQFVNAMLLNEVQKQDKRIIALEDKNRSLEERLARLEALIK